MGVDVIEVEIEGKNRNYLPGENIKGKIKLEIVGKHTFRGVLVQCQGKATAFSNILGMGFKNKSKAKATKKTLDVESESENSNKVLETETVLDESRWVIGGADKEVTLDRGRYLYSFDFHLPIFGLPGSLEGQHGWIRYEIVATAKNVGREEMSANQAFNVRPRVDLTRIPHCGLPVQFADSVMLGCCCCVTGPLKATFKLPKAGYLLGEVVTIDVDIRNSSNRSIQRIEACLLQTVNFHSENQAHGDTTTVDRVNLHGVEPRQNDNWRQELFHIPQTTRPSTAGFCQSVTIDWQVQISMTIDGNDKHIDGYLPIIVGNEDSHNVAAPKDRLKSHQMSFANKGAPMASNGHGAHVPEKSTVITGESGRDSVTGGLIHPVNNPTGRAMPIRGRGSAASKNSGRLHKLRRKLFRRKSRPPPHKPPPRKSPRRNVRTKSAVAPAPGAPPPPPFDQIEPGGPLGGGPGPGRGPTEEVDST